MRYYFVCKGYLEKMGFTGIARSVSAWIPRKWVMKKIMDIGGETDEVELRIFLTEIKHIIKFKNL